MAQRIDGRAIAKQVQREVHQDVQSWTDAGHRPPFLSAVLVGDNPASESYVRGKKKAAADAGIESETLRFAGDLPEADLLDTIRQLNADDSVDGILVQLPLPDHVDEQKIIHAIDPSKDVDGFHPENVGRLMIGTPTFVPATPAGILEMLDRTEIPTSGQRAVIVGRSNIVGKPLANLLMQRGVDATVTVCHSRTGDLANHTRSADILVAAVGRAEMITADMVKEGAAVIDVGINRVDDPSAERGYRLIGDVDFDAVKEKADWITPVPGGVGPMTIAMLLRNTFKAAQKQASA